jgi:hypothetical protein
VPSVDYSIGGTSASTPAKLAQENIALTLQLLRSLNFVISGHCEVLLGLQRYRRELKEDAVNNAGFVDMIEKMAREAIGENE